MLRVLRISAERTNFLRIVVREDEKSGALDCCSRIECSFMLSLFLPTPAEPEEKVIFGFAEPVARARLHGSTGARAYNLVGARLLLRAVVLTVNLIFHQLWQVFVQLSRALILDGTSGQRRPFMNSGAYQPVLAG
jgi:hypothetical protein